MRLIDADELKNKIKVIRSVGGGELRYITEADIDNAPTVEPELKRPHGRWVLNCKRYYCSECGEEAINLESEPDVYGYNYCLTKYCPNCGADMRGEEKGE